MEFWLYAFKKFGGWILKFAVHFSEFHKKIRVKPPPLFKQTVSLQGRAPAGAMPRFQANLAPRLQTKYKGGGEGDLRNAWYWSGNLMACFINYLKMLNVEGKFLKSPKSA